MLTHRPCGACGALVTPAGCPHWDPSVDTSDKQAQRRARDRATQAQRRAKEREQINELRRQLGYGRV